MTLPASPAPDGPPPANGSSAGIGTDTGDATKPTPGQSEPAVVKYKRRPRYSGKNPRRFEEKYKELNPEKYGEDLEKIISRGKTPAGMHRPIMVSEILARLDPRPGGSFVDATLGYGGHSSEILPRILPGGRLLGLDVDPIEQPKTEARLRTLGFGPEVLYIRHSNFAGIGRTLTELGWGPVEGILADLGVSSMQLDDPSRGFTYKSDGPLDLRLNPHRGISAADWLARVSVEKFARVLDENADEPQATWLAAELLAVARTTPFTRTVALADALRLLAERPPTSASPAEDPDTMVRRVFQALRIAVNEEFSALDAFLRALPGVVAPGGRVAILTFHSGEDRRVKQAFKEGRRNGVWSDTAEEVERPSREEVRANPRASSAKLRWAIRGN